MNMQAVLIRSVLLLAMSLALCLAIVERAYSQRQLPQIATVPAAAPIGQPAAVVLPTIQVKPTLDEVVAALESNDDFAAAAFIEAAQPRSIGSRSALPGLHLDMPYYSFGKTLPRVSKE